MPHILDSPIPKISISPAPPEEPIREPYSPFQSFTAPVVVNDNSFRPVHLTPPPTVHYFKRTISDTLRKPTNEAGGAGLAGERFQALLKATKERNASVGLRKELAIKLQQNKQAERRALFLSKVHSPPSPTAASTPKTPPDSPAIFHYTLPSPGLDSPLTHFKSVEREICDGWVEQVDFNLTRPEKRKPKPRSTLPSLEEISARLIPSSVKLDDDDDDGDAAATAGPDATFAIPRLSIDVGRLKLPLRALQPRVPSPHPKHEQQACNITTKPTSTKTTMVIQDAPRCSSPDKLTETNLNAFDIRGQRAHDMLSTLRRRTSTSSHLAVKLPQLRNFGVDVDDESKLRRFSAPADMAIRTRMGFEHAVLAMSGGF